MILNTAIFTATVQAAKAKAAGNASILRAIDRAVVEIERAKYWSFADGVLTIISTTSGERYVIGDDHTCHARSKTCKHLVARRLMVRYYERLATADVTHQAAPPVANEDAERERLIARINAAWQGRYSSFGIAQGLTKRFGVNKLSMVATHHLRAIVAVLK